MAELKTQPIDNSVRDFIAAIENEDRRRDCRAVLRQLVVDSVAYMRQQYG